MTAKDIISRAMLKRLTTDLARHLLDLDAEAVQVLETRNQRGRMGRDAPMNFGCVNHLNRAETHHPRKPLAK